MSKDIDYAVRLLQAVGNWEDVLLDIQTSANSQLCSARGLAVGLRAQIGEGHLREARKEPGRHMGDLESGDIVRKEVLNSVEDMRREVMNTAEDIVAASKKYREDADMALMAFETQAAKGLTKALNPVIAEMRAKFEATHKQYEKDLRTIEVLGCMRFLAVVFMIIKALITWAVNAIGD